MTAIIVTTLRAGLWAGIVSSVLAFLVLDFSFIPPLYTIDLHQAVDWVAVLSFLSAVFIINHLLVRARADAANAKRREYVAQMIAGITNAIGWSDGLESLLEAVVTWTALNLPIRGCAILLEEPNGELIVRSRAGMIPASAADRLVEAQEAWTTRAIIRQGEFPDTALSLPILAGDNAIGVLKVYNDEAIPQAIDEANFWITVTHQLGIAIERARLQAEVTDAEVLRRSDDLKSTLLSLVSHELQTPLTVIKTAATSLHQDHDHRSGAAFETLTGVIDRETDRLHHLVRNLLDLSRIDGGALRLSLDWYDLGELVRESVDRLRPVLGTQAVTVVVDADPPPIQLDYLLFDRVLANLILNAIRYAPSEAPIEIRVGHRDDQILLRVIDHGPGVPAQELGRIFDRFYRREGPWAGNGLGLALSKRIVEAHGGKIWAESRAADEPGLVIAVTLPVSLPPGTPRVIEGLDVRAAS
jgi:two-component system sensor histidine kinase KdpD